MISIFNSTTHYKGFVATNCEKNRKMTAEPVTTTADAEK